MKVTNELILREDKGELEGFLNYVKLRKENGGEDMNFSELTRVVLHIDFNPELHNEVLVDLVSVDLMTSVFALCGIGAIF